MKRTMSLILALAMLLSVFSSVSFAAAETQNIAYSETIAWDGEYDVIVVGFGGAGAVAARNAADAGAKVLLTEKAPEGHEGGNTRYCGQAFVNGFGDVEATRAYYDALAGNRSTSDAVMSVWAEAVANIEDILVEEFAVDKADFVNHRGLPGIAGLCAPEYPELPGADVVSICNAHKGVSDGYVWQMMRQNVLDRSDSIDVWFESPATKLIQDPVTKAILGVTISRQGENVNIKANNGVVLACGGFENNKEMRENYLGMPNAAVMGTLYNTGDGVRMAMEIGAQMWHMEAYEGNLFNCGIAFYGEEDERATQPAMPVLGDLFNGSAIVVGMDGHRYLREDGQVRHGHMYHTGVWENPTYSDRTFIVYDKAHAEVIEAANAIPDAKKKYIIEANTLEELAAATGMVPEILKETVENFNFFASVGKDYQLERAAETMTAFAAEGPYYAIEMLPIMLNTQGGPMRNEKAEVLDYEGKPIPHLYVCGELGGITALQYQGGGNVAECIIFGRIAGKNAAAVKTEEASPALTAVQSNLRFVPGAVTDTGAKLEIELAEGEYIGVSHSGMGGDLYLKVKMDGEKIADIEVVKHSESEGISDPAFANVIPAIIAANSTEVDTVAGATMTSKAIIEAVKDALAQK